MAAAFGPGEFQLVRDRGSKILIVEAWLLPLILASFNGQRQRQQNLDNRVMAAAFDLGEFQLVRGRGNKIMIIEAYLQPLVLTSYIGSETEATKS